MIIESLLDIDYYKLTMGYFAWKRFSTAVVESRFINRTKRDDINATLLSLKPDVAREIDSIRKLRFTEPELAYVTFLGFEQGFVDFLRNLELPEVSVGGEDTLDLQCADEWPKSIWWETLCLSVVNELFSSVESCCELADEQGLSRTDFFQAMLNGDLIDEARKRSWDIGVEKLMAKIEILKKNPDIRFSNFGTRRRYSREWQYFVDTTLQRELGAQFLGTSNVYNAWKLGLKPIGTNAHELYMICSRLMGDREEDIVDAHGKTLNMWMEDFGPEKSTALTDTFGTKFFFDTLTVEQSLKWLSYRHDSGDPFLFGQYVIEFFKSRHIDPMTKTLVFSDGLDLQKMLEIYDRFGKIINVIFGWGTNLTNDMGIQTLSIVMKPFRVNAYPLVKLSDNLNKATGPSQEDIDFAKRIYGYTNTQKEKTIY